MLERFSNGYLKATGHRVVNTPWTRYSLILFFAVDEDCEVSPLPQFVTAKNQVRYKSITQGEHIRRELARAEAYAEKAKR
jgi:isopenicillin N synthase-like dioxygenase